MPQFVMIGSVIKRSAEQTLFHQTLGLYYAVNPLSLALILDIMDDKCLYFIMSLWCVSDRHKNSIFKTLHTCLTKPFSWA
jgi:hypothetical protein